MMTVRDWVNFLNKENFKIGVKLAGDREYFPMDCYYSAKEILADPDFKAFLDDEVVDAFPFNLKRDGINYALLFIKN